MATILRSLKAKRGGAKPLRSVSRAAVEGFLPFRAASPERFPRFSALTVPAVFRFATSVVFLMVPLVPGCSQSTREARMHPNQTGKLGAPEAAARLGLGLSTLAKLRILFVELAHSQVRPPRSL